MKCELKTITPLHIGSGEEISPVEYLIDESKFSRINMESLFRDKDFNKEKFLEFVEYCTLQENIPYIGDFDGNLAKRHIRYQLDIKGKVKDKPQIKEFIKTSGKFYIPGSSIKGSILSALYWFGLSELCKNSDLSEVVKACLKKDFRVLNKYRGKEYIVTKWEKFQFDQILANLLFDFLIKDEVKREYIRKRSIKGREQIKNEIIFAPWLQVTDTNTVSESNASLVSAEVIGGRYGIPLFYEVIQPECKFEFELVIQKAKINEREILKISDEFYSKVLEAEIIWAEKHNINTLKEIENQKYKIRLGQGSSALATSLLILAKDLGIEKEYLQSWNITKYKTPPKTRKIVTENGIAHLMGWCVGSVIM